MDMVSSIKNSTTGSWSVKHRLVPCRDCWCKVLRIPVQEQLDCLQALNGSWALHRRWVKELAIRGWFHQKSLPGFLDLWSIDYSLIQITSTRFKKPWVGPIGLCSWAEWILSFVQEMGVRTDPQGSWFHQMSLPEFLDLWSIDWSLIHIASRRF